MVRLRPVPRKSTVDSVVEQLRGMIEQGRSTPGERLPTELELVEQLGVSRTVLREAISRLETVGLLTVRRGLGMFVGDQGSLSNCVKLVRTALAFTPKDLLEFTEFRRAVECYAARRAALLANQADLAELQSLCEAIDADGQGDADAMQADLRFHLKIIELTGNQLMRGVLEIVQEFSLAAMIETTPRPRDRQESRHRHGAILAAIASGDPDKAEAAMQSHFETTMARLKLVKPALELAAERQSGNGAVA